MSQTMTHSSLHLTVKTGFGKLSSVGLRNPFNARYPGSLVSFFNLFLKIVFCRFSKTGELITLDDIFFTKSMLKVKTIV